MQRDSRQPVDAEDHQIRLHYSLENTTVIPSTRHGRPETVVVPLTTRRVPGASAPSTLVPSSIGAASVSSTNCGQVPTLQIETTITGRRVSATNTPSHKRPIAEISDERLHGPNDTHAWITILSI